MIKKLNAFTLVELIITMTILAILWFVAYIMVYDYNKETRNSVRVTDVAIIETALELHFLDTWRYPDPDNYKEIYDTSNWVLLWKQWEIWPNVIQNLNTLHELPDDPILYKKYSYSVSYNNKKFELWYLKEN